MAVTDWPWDLGLDGSSEKHQALLRQFLKHYSEEDRIAFNRRICPPGRYPQSSGTWDSMCVLVYVVEKAFVMETAPPFQPDPGWPADDLTRNMMKTSDETRLKLLAEHWLEREKGVKGIDTEVEYDAGIADVVSNDHSWFIECGGSRSSKVLDFFRKSNESSNIVFFNEVGITSFRAGPLMKEYQEASSRYMSDKIRNMKGIL